MKELKTGFKSVYFSCTGKLLVSLVLFRFAWENLEKMSELFLTILVGMSSLWVAFEALKAGISLQISSIVTNLKEKHSEESIASLILKTLVWWKKSLMLIYECIVWSVCWSKAKYNCTLYHLGQLNGKVDIRA